MDPVPERQRATSDARNISKEARQASPQATTPRTMASPRGGSGSKDPPRLMTPGKERGVSGVVTGASFSHRMMHKMTSQSRVVGKQSVEDDEITVRAWLGYWVIYEFAHWFGAKRFFHCDVEKDLDAQGVQHMYNRMGRFLHLSFSSPTTKRTKKARRRRGIKAISEQPEHVRHPHAEGGHQDHPHEHAGALEAGHHAVEVAEHAAAAVVMEVIEGSKVEGDYAEEDVIKEQLRQFLPWFCIVWTLLLIGLWVGYALQVSPYRQTAVNVGYEEEWVLKKFTNADRTLKACKRECDKESGCKGIFFDFLPNGECTLLTQLHTESGSCVGESGKRFCGVYHYEKAATALGDIFLAEAGLDSAFPGETNLGPRRFCEDGLGAEVYRLLTYQFTHVGLQHVAFNCLLLLAFGIPLEGAYGSWWLGFLWTAGVIGGGLSWAVFDARLATVGASGGCYSLIGMHVSNIILNWNNHRYRWTIFLILLMVVSVELLFSFGINGGVSKTSHSAHGGGVVAGLCMGMLFGLDLDVTRRDKIIRVCTMSLAIFLTAFSIIWFYAANPLPATRNLLDSEAYCWLGQVCVVENPIRGTCDYSCVRCETRDCVESWYPKDADGNNDKLVYRTAYASSALCDELGYSEQYDRAPG